MCQRMGPRIVWATSNFIVFACMAVTAIISLISVGKYSGGIEHVIGGSASIRIAALVVFALLGFPLAVCIILLIIVSLRFFPLRAYVNYLRVADHL